MEKIAAIRKAGNGVWHVALQCAHTRGDCPEGGNGGRPAVLESYYDDLSLVDGLNQLFAQMDEHNARGTIKIDA